METRIFAMRDVLPGDEFAEQMMDSIILDVMPGDSVDKVVAKALLAMAENGFAIQRLAYALDNLRAMERELRGETLDYLPPTKEQKYLWVDAKGA